MPGEPSQRSQQVAAVFDRAAPTYDSVGVPWFTPIAEGLVGELAPAPGERALDVGCGRGAAVFPLAEAVGPTGRVTGIDLAPGMVEALCADVRARGLTTVDVQAGDAMAPDLGGRTVDVLSSSVHRDVPVRFRDAEQWHAWSWSHGQRSMWEAVPPEHHQQVRSAAAERLEEARDSGGTLTLQQQVRYTLARRPG